MGKPGAAVAERPEGSAGPTDHELVRRVRRGDERAFELLYARYQRRIAAYVYGMVKDYGRAEDVTQEVFVSALRRMRQTERPIAFKPWIYEIAKNACIDAYRRGRRAEEVSFDADDHLSPADLGRLVATGPGPDAAVDTKQDLDHLCGAFGGLSESHHEILVLRELEGLSYKDIGERMGMSRPAVESTLFRARKRLGEEYDELASGARCVRIQAIIDAGGARLGLRDQRRLARHISHCQPCRRLAARAGLGTPARTGVGARIAALLPLPAFLRFGRGGGEAGAGAANGWAPHVAAVTESLHSAWGKAATGLAAVLVAGAGVGVSGTLGDKRDERGTGYRPAVERPADGTRSERQATGSRGPATSESVAKRPGASSADRPARARARRDGAASGSLDAGRTAPAAPAPARAADPPEQRSGAEQPADRDPVRTPSVPVPADDVPEVDVPDVRIDSGARPVQEVLDPVTDGVGAAGQDTLDGVQETLPAPEQVAPEVTGAVEGAIGGARNAVEGAAALPGS